MDYLKQVESHYNRIDTEAIPYLSVDCIIFGFYENQLKVLLVRWKNTDEWSLPGGFIHKTESVDDSAKRVLEERTGLTDIFLRQFQTFGSVERYDIEDTWKRLGLPFSEYRWTNRTVSIGYYALVDFSKVTPTPDFLTEACEWRDVDGLPNLLFDHNAIIESALKTLRIQLNLQPVGYNLLPEKFTMPELQRLYETILGRSLDPRNFQKKILGLQILDRLKERRKGGAHRSPYLYSFNRERYEAALEEGSLMFL
ncbi:NrtR DNA-binding winged helix domain-containing protein [Telluribacter sp. SYSU D00476]|uniref:NUDIX hydrolase n=1 Tax=Telluribacter sp. SYSU D00476 TaxID=2811430 RepID=UPI001FF3A92F|nr:NUDIX domain-containing protein [Telluribacter sp. SYSU D00476]